MLQLYFREVTSGHKSVETTLYMTELSSFTTLKYGNVSRHTRTTYRRRNGERAKTNLLASRALPKV